MVHYRSQLAPHSRLRRAVRPPSDSHRRYQFLVLLSPRQLQDAVGRQPARTRPRAAGYPPSLESVPRLPCPFPLATSLSGIQLYSYETGVASSTGLRRITRPMNETAIAAASSGISSVNASC